MFESDEDKQKTFMKYLELATSEMLESKSSREKFMIDIDKNKMPELLVKIELMIPVSIAFKILEVLKNVRK